VEPLIAAMGDEDSVVRRSAAWALGQIGDARAVEPLIAALGDRDSDVRDAASQALRSLSRAADERSVKLLLATLREKDLDSALMAERTLTIPDRELMQWLFLLLWEERVDVSKAAAEILERLEIDRAIDLLVRVITASERPEPLAPPPPAILAPPPVVVPAPPPPAMPAPPPVDMPVYESPARPAPLFEEARPPMEAAMSEALEFLLSAPPVEEAAPEAPSPPPRYANYQFKHLKEYEEPSNVPDGQALRKDHWYELAVWIGAEATGLPLADEEGERRPVREPAAEQTATIYVLFEPDTEYFRFNENDRVQTLTLPPAGHGDSTQARLQLCPKTQSLSEDALARVDVRFYYEFNEVESIQIRAEIVGRDDDPPHSRFGLDKPIAASYRKLGDWRYLDDIERRAMHIRVRSLGTDRYELVFLYEGLEFKGAFELRKEDVEDVVLQARQLLEYLAVHPESPISGNKSRRLKELVRDRLTRIGSLLWAKMFQAERNKALAHVGQFLREHPLEPEGIIQVTIEDDAAGFVFPWNLLYDGKYPPDKDATLEELLEGFWGMRYCVEQFHGHMREAWACAPVLLDQELELGFILFEGLDKDGEHRKFLNNLPQRSQQRIRIEKPVTDAGSCFSLLTDRDSYLCSSHILYFFSRGYTRRRQADIAYKSDADAGELGVPEPERSYIELSSGKLYLDELNISKPFIVFKRRPVVLLNMCESAQVTPSLSESFVQFFLDLEVASLVGTECPMTTQFAHPFAVAFFDSFFGGDPLGLALLKARRTFLEAEGLMAPLGLAYTLFGVATVRYQPPPLVVEGENMN
jgi:hypothetical protein